MKFFRTHITRTFNVVVLLAGMVFYFLKPVNNHADHDAFASWLQSNLKSNSNAGDIVKQIRGLTVSGDHELESVIRKASILVKAHADDFEIPVDSKSQDENEVFQVLLKKWNDYQNASTGMGKAVLIKQTKPHSVLPADGLTLGTKALAQYHHALSSAKNPSFKQLSPLLYNYHISPLSGGTAIGAP